MQLIHYNGHLMNRNRTLDKIFLYHITNYKNFENILNQRRILCKNHIELMEENYINIAYEGIQDRRSRTLVSIAPFGNLHDYVPFYFAPRSPMLFAIHKRYVEGYEEGQESIIYFVFGLSKILNSSLDFVYTDGHPIMIFSEFYQNIEQLDSVIDWEIMESRNWNDTVEDNDRKRRRQAEFLIHKSVPIKLMDQIVVYNSTIKNHILNIIGQTEFQIPVKINRRWYY